VYESVGAARYPYGDPKGPNGLFFDRMILVRVENPRSGKAAMRTLLKTLP